MGKMLLLIAALLLHVVPAGATVLDFEGLTTTSATPLPTSYGGFTWDTGWYLYSQIDYTTPTHSGNYGIVNNSGTNPLGVSISSSTPFDFNGAWLAGWDFNAPSQIKAQGFDAANNLVAETPFMTIDVNSNKYLSANFDDVTRVNFVGGQYFTIDDFTFNESTSNPVPEPSTFLLLGGGVIGTFLLRRRMKKEVKC